MKNGLDPRPPRMRALSLCSGIGGLDLGLAASIPGYLTVCMVEKEAYCAGVLASRMEDGRLGSCPIWDDCGTFDGRPWRGAVDIVHGGYPCQPFSAAGKRKGDKDPRHLWPHIARIVDEVQPLYAFFENVPGHVSLGLQDVLADLRSMGFTVSAGIFSAAECGAHHLRKRLFIYAAHADRLRELQQKEPEQNVGRRPGDSRGDVPNTPGYFLGSLSAGRCRREAGENVPKPRGDGKIRYVADANCARCNARKPTESRKIWNKARREKFERRSSTLADADYAKRRPNRACRCGLAVAQYSLPFRRDQGESQPAERCGCTHAQGGNMLEPRLGHCSDDASTQLVSWEDGIPRTVPKGAQDRAEKLTALGNAVVPATAALAWRVLSASQNF